MNYAKFNQEVGALLTAHGITEFSLYGRLPSAKTDKKGNPCPADRLVWNVGNQLVAEEAAYHFGRIAVGQEP